MTFEEAIELLEKAMRLNPYHPTLYFFTLGMAYRLAGQYKERARWQDD